MRKLQTALVALALTGCAAQMGGPLEGDKSDEEGTRALGNNSLIVDAIDPNGTLHGTFEGSYPHGFTVDVRAGAKLSFRMRATDQGGDSADVRTTIFTAAGEEIPYETDGTESVAAGTLTQWATPGDQAAQVDADGWVTLPALEVRTPGIQKFVVQPVSDVAGGKYELEVLCDGSFTQCNRRPMASDTCEDRTFYIRGGAPLDGRQEWKACKVVLLENTTVVEGASLTIGPGVHVQGNYLGTDEYGTVGLTVNGTLHAVGEEDNEVVFESAADDKGWVGLTVAGDNAYLEHVIVQNARTGITVSSAAQNLFKHVVVDSCANGISIAAGGMVTIDNVNLIGRDKAGIGLSAVNGFANLDASVDQECTTVGEWCPSRSLFRRALVTGFETGIFTNDTELRLVDSTVAKNANGVRVTGPNAGVHPSYDCPAAPRVAQRPVRPPAPPTRWRWDPEFIHCDIVDNDGYGIRVEAPQILRINRSNLLRNGGHALEIAADHLGAGSYVKESNLYQNNTGGLTADCGGAYGETCVTPQIDAWHTTGTLDLQDNYWVATRDPYFAQTRTEQHSQAMTCTVTRAQTGCGVNRACGAYQCNRSANCTHRGTAQWSSPINWSGFWPVENGWASGQADAMAGPRGLEPPVSTARGEIGLN